MKLFLTVLIISVLSGAEVDLFIPSFPEIQRVFGLSPFLVQLTLSANFISYALSSLFIGSLGDRFNRRTVMLTSLWIFVVASILCVCATHYSVLVLGRFLQGIGMAGPSVLGYVLIADAYPLKKQMAVMGLLNGTVTMAMAFAPVIGSYVNLFFNWRANFFILLCLAVLSLVASYVTIPARNGDPSVSLSPKSYLPLFRSSKLMILLISLSCLSIAYWVFIGMAPILYMESLGVDLEHFGYYQGSLALAFSLTSILSPKILKLFGLKNCLLYSLFICAMISPIIFVIAVVGFDSAIIITLAMLVFSAAVVFPVQILFPMILQVKPSSKSRASALIVSARLLFSAIFLELVSYFYTGSFFLLGLLIATFAAFSVFLIMCALHKKWIVFD